MLVGSVLGALMAERWHTKLAARAHDPSVGREAEARYEVLEAEKRRTDYKHQRPLVDDRTERVSTPEDGAALLGGDGSRSHHDATHKRRGEADA